MSNRTYVACRPGMLQSVKAAFGDLDVEVDENLDKDYEFRERELTFAEALEAEVERAEKHENDPKNALTFVIPLREEDHNWCDFLVLRVDQHAGKSTVEQIINSTSVTVTNDQEDAHATAGALRIALRKAGVKIHSISVATGLTWPDL